MKIHIRSRLFLHLLRSISPGRALLPRRPNFSTKTSKAMFLLVLSPGPLRSPALRSGQSGSFALPESGTVEMRPAADKPKGIDWLWPGRIMPAKSG